MMKIRYALCVVCFGALIGGCAKHSILIQDTPESVHFKPLFSSYTGDGYSPGFTGYTQGYDSYGGYDDGFGPSWWNPRFNFYSGSLTGYSHYPYPQ